MARDRQTPRAKLAGLYEGYYDRIARYVYSHVGDRGASEDIASTVFMKALESVDRYQERGVPMQAWLFKIAHNLIVDHWRKRTKRPTEPIDLVEVEDRADPPEQATEKKDEIERVVRAMSGLTEDQREVLKLRFLGELTSGEVAKLIGKRDGAVREMQRAALEKLRGILAGQPQ
jgi:RNA polymerase sigma-70 factor (ECF subfamily)